MRDMLIGTLFIWLSVIAGALLPIRQAIYERWGL